MTLSSFVRRIWFLQSRDFRRVMDIVLGVEDMIISLVEIVVTSYITCLIYNILLIRFIIYKKILKNKFLKINIIKKYYKKYYREY